VLFLVSNRGGKLVTSVCLLCPWWASPICHAMLLCSGNSENAFSIAVLTVRSITWHNVEGYSNEGKDVDFGV
jgi:hypothetical protein